MKELTVIKFGGSLSKNPRARKKFLDAFARLARRGRYVLVHGGGPEINAWLARLGIASRFAGGLRYTDAETLEIVEMVLTGKVNKGFVGELAARGARAAGISGRDGGMALCRRVRSSGFVGEPLRVNGKLVASLLDAGYVPVISSIGFDRTGQPLNMNADALAMGLASALKASRLVLLTDVPGVLDLEKKTIKNIRLKEIPKLISSGIVTGGMIPKLKACAGALRSGVGEVWIALGDTDPARPKGTRISK